MNLCDGWTIPWRTLVENVWIKVQHCTSEMAVCIHLLYILLVFPTAIYKYWKLNWNSPPLPASLYPLQSQIQKQIHTRGKISSQTTDRHPNHTLQCNWTLSSRPSERVCLFQPLPTLPHLGINKGAEGGGRESYGLGDMSRSHTATTQSHPVPRSPLCVCVRCRSQVSNPRSPSAGSSHWIIQERLNALCRELTGTKPHLGRISHHKLCSKSALAGWKCCDMLGINRGKNDQDRNHVLVWKCCFW